MGLAVGGVRTESEFVPKHRLTLEAGTWRGGGRRERRGDW